MERLRFEEENRAYEQMVPSPSTSSFRSRPPPHSRPSSHAEDGEEEVTYADVNRQVALIINILISIVACSCAIWMASGHWSTPRRLGLSMAGGGLVGIAEVVVYAGYLRKIQAAKKESRRRVETKTITRTWIVGREKKDR